MMSRQETLAAQGAKAPAARRAKVSAVLAAPAQVIRGATQAPRSGVRREAVQAPQLTTTPICRRATFRPSQALKVTEPWLGQNAIRTNVQVLRVINTQPSGVGSFREALAQVDAKRLTVITFTVGGTITGTGYAIAPEQSCLYIAAQTAPGGIQLHNPNGANVLVLDRSGPEDVVVRYLRSRSSKGTAGAQDVVNVHGGRRIIFDHTSSQFGNDEVFSMRTVSASNAKDIRFVTLQYNLIAAGLRPHSTGSLMGGGPQATSDITLHHNLWSDNSHRNPLLEGSLERVQMINNVTYNYKGQPAETTGIMPTVDFVANYWKPGPWSRKNKPVIHLTYGGALRTGVLFAAGNVHTHVLPNAAGDQNELFVFSGDKGDAYPDYGKLPAATFRSSRSAAPAIAVTEQTATTAFSSVLATVGAFQHLDCKGNWVASRDPLDALFVEQAQKGGGSGSDDGHDHPDDFGGIPTPKGGTSCADSDTDGMPDAFESRYGLDPNNAKDASLDDDGDGYVNIEEYINGTQPK